MDLETYIREEFQEMKDRHDRQDKRLDCIEAKLDKYKGFLGGVTFVLSCLGAFFAMALKVVKGGNT